MPTNPKSPFTHTTAKILFLATLLCFTSIKGFATAWTTATAGPITTLTNWTDGASGTPASFTTPGDTWTVNMVMTMTTSTTWTLGTAASTPVVVTFAPGGSLIPSTASGIFNIYIYGDVQFTGGTFSISGASCTCNLNIFGNFTMSSGSLGKGGSTSILNLNLVGNCNISGGTIDIGGSSGSATLDIHGNYTMTGGTIATGGSSTSTIANVYGNFSTTGPCAITNTGTDCTSNVALKLPSSSGTMMIENTSTGAWSKTTVSIMTGCTAQLVGNFSTNTGAAYAYGLFVYGTLVCPAAYVVNGSSRFNLQGDATLVVGSPLGVNGNIVSTGPLAFSSSNNFTFNGTVPQVTGTYFGTYNNRTITIANPAGVTLTLSVQAFGTLAFAAGILHTGSLTITTLGSPTSVTGAGATSYVDGTLIKTISGFTFIDYQVGDLTYAPMSVSLDAPGTAGSIGLKATNGMHPAVSTSGLAPSNMVNHYWTVTNTGAAGPANASIYASYPPADVLGGINTDFLTQKYVSAAWLASPLSTTNSPGTSSPAAPIPLATLAGQYIFGNIFCGTLGITGITTLCAGTTTTLSNPTPGGTWSSSAPGVATISATGVVTGLSGGTAIISYTASGCAVPIIVTVNPLPSAGIITGPATVCVGDTITLLGAVSGGLWSSVFTTIATVSTTGMVIGITPGIDTIVYTVTNSCGSAKAKKVVEVLSASSCTLPLLSSNTPLTTPQLNVYPNPNTGSFTIQLLSPENKNVRIIITDIVGRQVQQLETTTNSKAEVSFNEAPGIYIVTVSTATNKYFVKIVVE